MQQFFVLISVLLLGVACTDVSPSNAEQVVLRPSKDTLVPLENQADSVAKPVANRELLLLQADSAWVNLAELLPNASYDIRYAGTNNFMELQVYECPACFLRLKVAKALMQAQQELDSLGLSFKFFDCYRPTDAQWALWRKKPDSRYVHPPKLGSMHSRGGAVDITLVDVASGKALKMGTPFDYFGKEAYWSYQNHPPEVLKNRRFLRTLMEKHGFRTIATEWWHFDFVGDKFELSNMQWPCHVDSLQKK